MLNVALGAGVRASVALPSSPTAASMSTRSNRDCGRRSVTRRRRAAAGSDASLESRHAAATLVVVLARAAAA